MAKLSQLMFMDEAGDLVLSGEIVDMHGSRATGNWPDGVGGI